MSCPVDFAELRNLRTCAWLIVLEPEAIEVINAVKQHKAEPATCSARSMRAARHALGHTHLLLWTLGLGG